MTITPNPIRNRIAKSVGASPIISMVPMVPTKYPEATVLTREKNSNLSSGESRSFIVYAYLKLRSLLEAY